MVRNARTSGLLTAWPAAHQPTPTTRCTRPTPPPPARSRWCDVDGSPIALFCQVKQVAEGADRTALFSRLHEQGQVIGRDLDSLYVRFPGNLVLSVPPHLLRVLDAAPGGD